VLALIRANWPFFLLAVLGMALGALNLTGSFHKVLDWDTAFWFSRVRNGMPTCCLHPLQDNLWWFYKALFSLTQRPLLSLQVFFLFFLVAGSILYGRLFFLLSANLRIALLAVATFSLFPLIQNLASFFEDNVFKQPFLIATMVLIFSGDNEKRRRNFLLATILFTYCVLLALDTLLWLPTIAAVMLWVLLSDSGTSRRKALGICVICISAGVVSLLAFSTAHDYVSGKEFGTGLEELYGKASYPLNQIEKSQSKPKAAIPRTDSYLLEQIDPLLGMRFLLFGENYDGKIYRRSMWPIFSEHAGKLGHLRFPVLAFHVFFIGIILYAFYRGARASRTPALMFTAIVAVSYVYFFTFNYFYVDVPNERYDHFLLLLPLILFALRLSTEPGKDARDQSSLPLFQKFNYLVLAAFLILGMVHLLSSPKNSSYLSRQLHAFPGQYDEYYFAFSEVKYLEYSEALYLAGYNPLHIINVDKQKLTLQTPSFIDIRSNEDIDRYLENRKGKVFISPAIRQLMDSQSITGTEPAAD